VEPRLQAVIERYLDVRSLFFRVEAEAEQNGQTTRLRALARRGDNGGIHIVQWLF
jgi:type II secretory pathway component PulK